MQGLASLADAAAAAAAAAHESFGEDDDSSEAESEAGEEAYDSCASAVSSVCFAGCESATDDEDFCEPNGGHQQPREEVVAALHSSAIIAYDQNPTATAAKCSPRPFLKAEICT